MRFTELTEAVKTVGAGVLFHVGSMDATQKRRDSHEGAGLSVSLHPNAWRGIARGFVGGQLWKVVKKVGKPRLLDYHALSRADFKKMREWGISNGYVEPATSWRFTYYDEDAECKRWFDCETREEAEAELDSYFDDDEPPADTIKKVVSGFIMTPKLQARCNLSGHHYLNCYDLLCTVWADDVLGLDSIWWDDDFDVANLSAPRGVIFPNRTFDFEYTEVDETEAPDHLMESEGDAFISNVNRWASSQDGDGYNISPRHYRWYNGEWEIEIKKKASAYEVHMIRIEKDNRGEGFGRIALNAICACADKAGVTLRLQASGESDWLVDWYARYGFRVTRKAENGPWMVRVPSDSASLMEVFDDEMHYDSTNQGGVINIEVDGSRYVLYLDDSIAFRSEELYKTMDASHAAKVLNAIIKEVVKYVKEQHPPLIQFMSASPSRQKLYRAILRRMKPMLDEMGYRVIEKGTAFIIQR